MTVTLKDCSLCRYPLRTAWAFSRGVQLEAVGVREACLCDSFTRYTST